MSSEQRSMKGGRDVESRRIDWLRQLHETGSRGSVSVPLGDDAAALRPRPGHEVILSVDAQSDGTHFRREWLEPRDLGRRAIHASISDLAAMMCRPTAILVSLLLPQDYPERSFRALVRGIDDAARHFDTPVVGGNTSRGPLSLTITVVGETPRGEAVRRDGLRPGDEIWVTGSPGLARLGWHCLEKGRPKEWSTRDERLAVKAWRSPTARVHEALAIRRALCRRRAIHAAVDLSDGLGRDLGHMVDASREAGRDVQVELSAEALDTLEPLARLCTKRADGPQAHEVALRGGEDYELCFATPAGALARSWVARFQRRFGVKLRRVGRVIPATGSRRGERVRVLRNSGRSFCADRLDRFDHF